MSSLKPFHSLSALSIIILALSALCFTSLSPSASAQDPVRTRMINPISNGGFEQFVESTDSPGTDVYGSYWCNAEGKILPENQPEADHYVRLYGNDDYVMQLIPAYEYVAQGENEHNGHTTDMTVQFFVKPEDGAKVRVVVEETPEYVNGAYWGFYQTFDNQQVTDVDTELGDDWWYATRTLDTSRFKEMLGVSVLGENGKISPYLSFLYGDCDCPLCQEKPVKIRWSWQQIGLDKNLAAVRGWVAPETGTVLVQSRFTWNKNQIGSTAYPNSEMKLRIYIMDDTGSPVIIDELLDEDVLLLEDDVFSFRRYVDVEEGNVIAFETYESLTDRDSAPVLVNPNISYTGRRVEYWFSTNPIDVPDPTPEVLYIEGRRLTPGYWNRGITLPVGQDYANYFSSIGEIDFVHGPVPRLALRLQSMTADKEVCFDDISAQVYFRTYSEEDFLDKLRAEMLEVIGNWLEYACDRPYQDCLAPNVVFNITNGDPMVNLTLAWGSSVIFDYIMNYSTQFWHPEATPWLLKHCDSVVDNRYPESQNYHYDGIRKAFDLQTQARYMDPPVGKSISLYQNILFFLDLYDLTHDITYLDMAAYAGNYILDYGKWDEIGTSEDKIIYHSTFSFSNFPIFTLPDLNADKNDILWSRSGMALARLHYRTKPFSGVLQRRDLYRVGDYLDAVQDTARYVNEKRTGQWGPWWLKIDTALDDHFGHNAFCISQAYREHLDYYGTHDTDMYSLLSVGVEEFQPHWIQTMPRGTGMAGDQQRAWDAWMDVFKHELPLNPQEAEQYGQAYVDAALHYFRGCQLGNGAWGGAVTNFYWPNLGGIMGTPLVSVNAHQFKPLAVAYEDVELYDDGQGITGEIREDILAYLISMFEVTTLHFGNLLKHLEYVSEEMEQCGYMKYAEYGEFVYDPEHENAEDQLKNGYEIRGTGCFAKIMGMLEEEGHRPLAWIRSYDFEHTTPTSHTIVFQFTDPDGISDIDTVQIIETTYEPEQEPVRVILDPPCQQITDGFKYTYTTPEFVSRNHYRYQIIGKDLDDRWSMDSVLYEID